MRERQQMASRPFASVAVALELGGDQEELLQVSATHTHTQIHISCTHTQGEAKYCDGKAHSRVSEVQVCICTANAEVVAGAAAAAAHGRRLRRCTWRLLYLTGPRLTGNFNLPVSLQM